MELWINRVRINRSWPVVSFDSTQPIHDEMTTVDGKLLKRHHWWFQWVLGTHPPQYNVFHFHAISIKYLVKTRMHSSTMRTVRCSGRWGGGICRSARQDMSAWGGGGVVAAQCMPDYTPSPCKQNDWQTCVKTLPFYNFVCGRYLI